MEEQKILKQQKNIINDHDLDLCLGPCSQKHDTDALKRKAEGVMMIGEDDDGGLDRHRRKVVNWWGNVEGVRVCQGQNGHFLENYGGRGPGGCENSFSTGSSSGGSDSYHSNSIAGGHSSDTSSHSSHSRLHSPAVQQPKISNEETNRNSHNHNRSSSNVTSTDIKYKEPNSTSRSPSPKDSKVVIGKPPKPKRQMSQQSVLLPQMPCVSATGNGPEGKTITGFLYKYSKAEVSIVCVCHGTSFSPAGFVEHAGGVDVEHPLRHIRVTPFTLS